MSLGVLLVTSLLLGPPGSTSDLFEPVDQAPVCAPTIRERFELCMVNARALPVGVPEDDPGVVNVRRCLSALAAVLETTTIEEALALDPDEPLLHARSGAARALYDDTVAGIDALADALAELARAPREDISGGVELVRGHARQTTDKLQQLNGLLTGRSGLVARGGSSMGVYQGGYIYYATEFFKLHGLAHPQRRPGFSVVSGSSAGAINAAMAAITSCRQPNADFLSSAFFHGWVGTSFYIDEGWPSLLDDANDPRGALSTGPMRAAEAELLVMLEDPDGWIETDPSCRVVVGLTTTRTTPRVLAIGLDSGELPSSLALGRGPDEDERESDSAGESGPELGASLLEERFGFVIEAFGQLKPSRPVVINNVRPRVREARSGFSATQLERMRAELYPYLGDSPHDPVDPSDFFSIVKASASFPIAFAPERVDYGIEHINGSREQLDDVDLVDGGVFDNHPFGFAASLREWTRAPDKACDPLRSFVPERPTEFLFVEPTLASYDSGGEPARRQACGGRGSEACLLGTYSEFVLGFLDSSREASLLKDADELPYLRMSQTGVPGDTVSLPRRGLPIAGEQLGHFLAFFETDFRVFDFVVGMVDAERHFTAHEVWRHSDVSVAIDEPRVTCLREYWAERDAGRLPVDIRVEEGDVPALPQSCRELFLESTPELARAHASPDRLRGDNHNFVALLVTAHDYMGWQGSPQHRAGLEFDRWFEELERADFRFVDLQRLARNRVWLLRKAVKINAGRARKLIRDITEIAIDRLAKRQEPRRHGALISLVGKAGANYLIDYRHPTKIVSLGITPSGLDFHFGVSPHVTRLRSTALRFDFGARANRLGPTLLRSPDPDFEDLDSGETPSSSQPWTLDVSGYMRLTLAGPGFLGAAAKRSHGATVQTELGAGFVVSEGLVFAEPGHRSLRYGPEVWFGVTIVQRILLGAWTTIWVDGCRERASRCLVASAYEESSFDRARVTVGGTLGWRWLPL